jgi:leucine dehydrogenase
MNRDHSDFQLNFPPLFGPHDLPHERIVITTDRETGLQAIVAVHNTARGPGFGGCRYWQYADSMSALLDAQRLAEGMSYKNALADLPFGGGKAVLLKSGQAVDREALFKAFGRLVQSLDGLYVTAEDVGTSTADMHCVATQTQYVSGLPRAAQFGGDPSPKTAYGVFVSIRQGVRSVLGRSSLQGVRVAVQGLGAVGSRLCAYLAEAGAVLLVADIDAAKVQPEVEKWSAIALDNTIAHAAEVDVYAPCALGACLNEVTIPQIKAKLIAGAANNQLATIEDGDRLHQSGIIYLPDFMVNAGGIISVSREYLGQGNEQSVMAEVGKIEDRTAELLQRMTISGSAPARLALEWAREKMVA